MQSINRGKIYFLLLLLLLLCLPGGGSAQVNQPSVNSSATIQENDSLINPIEKIMEDSDGKVEIIVSKELLENILKSPSSHKKTSGQGKVYIRPGLNKISGYRIQVFADGRNQHSLEARAKARGAAIISRFPKYRGQVYTFSSSPNWYTRVGNYRSQSEANDALMELKSAFPSFANEMRIVKCQIVVIK